MTSLISPSCLVSVKLVSGEHAWIAAGVAGGLELPAAAEPFKMRVTLPVALGKALGFDAHLAAAMSGRANSFEEDLGPLRWLRWRCDLDDLAYKSLGLDTSAGQLFLARHLGEAIGTPLFAQFELGKGARWGVSDWVSTARESSELLDLYACLESLAIGLVARDVPKAGGSSRL